MGQGGGGWFFDSFPVLSRGSRGNRFYWRWASIFWWGVRCVGFGIGRKFGGGRGKYFPDLSLASIYFLSFVQKMEESDQS